MNIETLNIINLDGTPVTYKSISNSDGGGNSGGGGISINNQNKSVDITENGTTEVVADSGYTGLGRVTINTEVEGAKPKWTGHADAEGLRAIGWTDEDIAYYQENGVNWNEEDDEYHKVTDDNKALYGVLTASNISTYKDRIVYLPKIDTSGVTSMNYMFKECYSLAAIPQLDTSQVTSMLGMFSYCYSLTSIPLLDTSKVTSFASCFRECMSLIHMPTIDTSNAQNVASMFISCYSLQNIPTIDTSNVQNISSVFEGCLSMQKMQNISTAKVKNLFGGVAANCPILSYIDIDLTNIKDNNSVVAFKNNVSLKYVYIKGVGQDLMLDATNVITKESLLYIINNEAATSAITIKLASYAYDRWATDPDIVAALANHPNISISK